MVRVSPLYDFPIIFNAILCKITPRIRLSIYFWPPDKIDGIMAVFFVKKLTQLKITWMVAWWLNPRLMIFWLFSMLLLVKWSIESDFQFTFDHLTKFTELGQIVTFFLQENCHNSVNFVWWSKVNGRSDSTDNFTWSSIENNLKIIRRRFPHHDTIHVIFNFVNLFSKKLP